MIELNSDIFTHPGYSHPISQDYGLIGEGKDGGSYAIICDGCSTAVHTDVGARIIAHVAQNYLLERCDHKHVHPNVEPVVIASQADVIRRAMGLPNEVLNSTLMMLIAHPERKHINCFIYGDGIVVHKNSRGVVSVHIISYGGNAPFYLNYHNSADAMHRFAAIPNNDKSHDVHWFNEDGSLNSSKESCGLSIVTDLFFDIEDTDWIAIMSDGAESFQQKYGGSVDVLEIVSAMTAFKNVKGSFVERRASRELENLSKASIKHHDDFTFAAINVHNKTSSPL